MSKGKNNNYGKTWWGKAWVEAIEKIDYYTNRLPRGRSYANAGRVCEIKLDNENACVRAKVQGTRSKPYKVEIKLIPFTPDQKKIIKAIIARDPSWASELSLGKMPPKILETLEKHNIYLLPESWDDLSASCSCPDWASPCKHLAAVYYIMAAEIDKDPFILFKLRNLETKELLQAAGFISKDANADTTFLFNLPRTSLLPFVPYTEVKSEEKNEQSSQRDRRQQGQQAKEPDFPFDLNRLAEKLESKAIFNLLSDSPLFYPQDNFKTLLLKAYNNVAAAVEKRGFLENEVTFKDTEFTLLYPSDKQPHNFSFFVSSPQNITPPAVDRFGGGGDFPVAF